MGSRLGVLPAVVTACLVVACEADAAGTYTLCSTGAGKPLVSPALSGKCATGQKALVLANGASVASLQAQVATLQTQVASLNTLLAGVSRTSTNLVFNHMNLQVESGSGATGGTVNGLGNVIIGYNENPGTQTGSNNLVVGTGQSFTSYGGIVAGQHNEIDGAFSSIAGGYGNDTAASWSTIAGGEYNVTNGNYSFIGAGCSNASGTSVVGINPCDSPGGQAILGGAGVTLTGTDTTSP